MECKECGAAFTQYKSDQNFCSAAHSNKYHQRLFRNKQKGLKLTSSELDQLKQDNEALRQNIKYEQDRFEDMKEVLKKHDDIVDKMVIEIDRQKDELREKDVIIGNRNSEIERLKLEIEKTKRKGKNAPPLFNSPSLTSIQSKLLMLAADGGATENEAYVAFTKLRDNVVKTGPRPEL
jgi:chromosome segregation ATPase